MGVTLRFERNISSLSDTVQYGSSLTEADWADIDIDELTNEEVILGSVVNGMQSVDISIDEQNAVDAKLFYRLKVERLR